MDKISVIVPVYNSIDCLERCVKSICAQTYPDLEILLVDDGSTDGTDSLCERLAGQDSRIKVYHKKNGGASSARNMGIRMAEGDYLGFVDSDDYIEPYVYEEMMKVMVQKKCTIAQISRDEVDEEGNRLPDVCVPPKEVRFCERTAFIKELLLHQGDCSFCTKLVKKELFDRHLFPEGVLNEDFRLLVEMIQEIDGIAILPQQGYHVVCRMESTTRKKTEDSFSRVFLDIVDNADLMQELVDRAYPELHAYAVRFNLYQRLDYLLHVPISQMNETNTFYLQVKKYLRRHLKDIITNPYLTKKQKCYLLLFAGAPKTVRSVHRVSMKARINKRFLTFFVIVWLVLMATAFFFCTQKQGFHEDEYYTYYSTARTNGFYVEDGQWMDRDTICNEFVVLPGQGFQYGLVKQVQSWDVHPPLYYWVFHTAASLVPGTFSKWIGLWVNLFFHGINIILLTRLSYLVSGKNQKLALLVTFFYGLTPAAISGVVFIRMYEMLTMWVLLCAILHVKAVQNDTVGITVQNDTTGIAENGKSRGQTLRLPVWSFLVPLSVVTYLGFLTQYYYVIFLFYIGLAFCVYLLWRDRNLWNCLCYGISQVIALVLAYATYPSCLGQMFKGQRGAQATENFFDVSNTLERLRFFCDLLNEYVFGKLLAWLLLALVLLAVTARALAGRGQLERVHHPRQKPEESVQGQVFSNGQSQAKTEGERWARAAGADAAFWMLVFAAAGYFLTVSKTALLLGATSNRYQLPVYGVIVLLLFAGIYQIGRTCVLPGRETAFPAGTGKFHHFSGVIWAAAVVLLLLADISGLAGGKVVFLYPEDEEQVEFARARAREDAPVVYFYEESADWCIWDVTDELMEYPEVYFAAAGQSADEDTGTASEQITDERIANATELVVYVADGADAEEQMKRIKSQYPQFTECELMFEEKYCQVYWMK